VFRSGAIRFETPLGVVALMERGTHMKFILSSCRFFSISSKMLIFLLLSLVIVFLSCSEDDVVTPDEPYIQKEERHIADIYYVDNTYFFLDNPYGPFFRPQPGKIEVFVSLTDVERQNPEIISYYGLAFVDTTARGTQIKEAKALFEAGLETPPREEGYFKELSFGQDYRYILDIEDESVLGIELRWRIEDKKVLAVRYINEIGDSIGDYNMFPIIPFPSQEQDYPIFLELIKSRNPRPTDQFGHTWDFMLRNIYNLGIYNIDPLTLEIEIEDFSNNLVNTYPEGETVPYIRIFGLDQYDKTGAEEPDGLIDLHAGLIDFRRGLLTFPSLRPFDPRIEDVDYWTRYDTSFAVPDDYMRLNLANPTIYDDYLSSTDLQKARRYDIVVRMVSSCPCTSDSRDFWNSSGEISNRIFTTIPWLEVSR
jgi:hypothetical protein